MAKILIGLLRYHFSHELPDLIRIFLIIFVTLTFTSFAQIKDIGGVDYTTLAGDGGDADFSRTRIWINIPIKYIFNRIILG